MNNSKVIDLVKRIAADFRELERITGEEHIRAFIIKKHFSLNSTADKNGQIKLNFFITEAEYGESEESTTDSI